MDHQLSSVDGHCVLMVGATCGSSLGLTEQPCCGTGGDTGTVLAAGCTGCLWKGSSLFL